MKIILTLLIVFPLFCKAQKSPCDGETQAQMTECAILSFKEADKMLNQSYKTFMAKCEANHKPFALTAQRQWIAYRDAQCLYEAKRFEGGSMQAMVKNACLENITKKRTEELILMVKSLEN